MAIGYFILPPYGIQIIVSPLGIALLFIIAIFFFLYAHIFFSCLYLLIIYFFFLKNSNMYNNDSIQYTTQTIQRDIEMEKMKGPTIITLEESIISSQDKPLITHNNTMHFASS
jgi:hypothetical protein